MIGKIDTILFKKIKRISPSQFNAMRGCSYKSLLAEAFNKTPLLPFSPNAYLGTVAHKMLELISQKKIKTEVEFDKVFEKEIQSMETNLGQQGYSFFVPLKMNVKDFGVTKFFLKQHIKYENETGKRNDTNSSAEKWLESRDGLIGGKMDLVIEGDWGVEIIDFKTGAIVRDALDDNGETILMVKDEYQEQLKLYAYLYFDNTGFFPTRLSLVNLSKQKFNVSFTIKECETIFHEAKDLLYKTNESVESKKFNANPSVENCKYCLYRPACSYFLHQLKVDDTFNDITGIIKKVVKYQNGNVTVFIQCQEKNLSVTGFQRESYESLHANENKKINIFNLRKSTTEFVYSATKTTMIYD